MGQEIQIVSCGTQQCSDFGGQRSQQKGAGKKHKAMVPGEKCFRREGKIGCVRPADGIRSRLES